MSESPSATIPSTRQFASGGSKVGPVRARIGAQRATLADRRPPVIASAGIIIHIELIGQSAALGRRLRLGLGPGGEPNAPALQRDPAPQEPTKRQPAALVADPGKSSTTSTGTGSPSRFSAIACQQPSDFVRSRA